MYRMSSGRIATSETLFSARQRIAYTGRVSDTSSLSVRNAPRTAAAPPMSRFIPGMPSLDLMESPPVSYTMPLPTRQMEGASAAAAAGRCSRTTSAGRCVAALPTPHRPPKPRSRSSTPRMTVVDVALLSAATLRAMSTNASVCSSEAGASTRAAAMRADAHTDRTASSASSVTPAPLGTRVIAVRREARAPAPVLREYIGKAFATATQYAGRYSGACTAATTMQGPEKAMPERAFEMAWGWAGQLWWLQASGSMTTITRDPINVSRTTGAAEGAGVSAIMAVSRALVPSVSPDSLSKADARSALWPTTTMTSHSVARLASAEISNR
mmetsp:Transcript_24787/g.93752  ORF Transcript_24787/g.93752 Transcript_24787/m.93752 type:complete len:327 (+) Transcript_24787:656-1636(+)